METVDVLQVVKHGIILYEQVHKLDRILFV